MHESKRHSRKEFVIFDETNPRSLVNLVPEQMAKKIKDLWQSEDRFLLGLPEPLLLKELTRRNRIPGPVDRRLRLQFWLEFDRVMDCINPTPMNFAYVVGYTMSKEAFNQYYVQDYGCLAYIICPPSNYEDLLHSALEASLLRMKESLEVPLVDKHDRPITSALKHVLAVEKRLAERVKALEKIKPPVPQTPILTEPEPAPEPPEPQAPGEDQLEKEREERKKKLAALQKDQRQKGVL